jgi:hypothetical protein
MAALFKLRLLRIASKHAMEFSVYVVGGGHKKEPPAKRHP